MSARRPAIVVHDLDQATAALRAAAAAGVAVTLWSAPGAAAYAGLGFLRALFEQAGETVPEARHDVVIDCAGSAVLAHEALSRDFSGVAFSGRGAMRKTLGAIAAQEGRRLVTAGPGRAALDLARSAAPERDSAAFLAKRRPPRSSRVAADRRIAEMDAASPAIARAAVGSPWRTALFERHCSGAVDCDWPVAVLGPLIAEAVGARSHTLRLSRETAAKQRARHRDIEVEDYARLQRILDEGEWFKQSATNALGYVEEDGRLWRAVLKIAKDRSKTYLTSFHRVDPPRLWRARKTLERIWG